MVTLAVVLYFGFVNSAFFTTGNIITIDGGGSITFTGTGTTVLTTDTNTGSSNTYNGGSTLAMGTLVIANASVGSAIGSGNITLNGGVLASAATGGIISGAVIAGANLALQSRDWPVQRVARDPQAG